MRFFTEPNFSFCPTDFRFSGLARQLDGNSSSSCFHRLPEEVNQFRHVMIEGEEVALLPNALAEGLQVLAISQLDGKLLHRFKNIPTPRCLVNVWVATSAPSFAFCSMGRPATAKVPSRAG
jgi:hypothetical protein